MSYLSVFVSIKIHTYTMCINLCNKSFDLIPQTFSFWKMKFLFFRPWGVFISRFSCLPFLLIVFVRVSKRGKRIWGSPFPGWSASLQIHICVANLDHLPLLVSRGLACMCDQVCPWLAAGRWFSPDTLVSSINKTDHHDITEILWKVALNTIILLPICNVLHKNEDLEEDTLVRSY